MVYPRSRLRRLLPVFGIVLGFVLTSEVVRQRGGAASSDRIVFGVDLSVISTPVWIAEHLGYFREQGLDVKIVDYSSGRTALADMVAGKNKLDVVTVAQTPVMYNSFAGRTYTIVAGMAYSYDDVVMLARRDRGIVSPSDLKGKRIGTPVGSSGHFLLWLFLVHQGLHITDVKVVDLDAPLLPGALARGTVDAIATWQPHIHNARKLVGDAAVLLPNGNIYREDFYMVSDKRFLKGNSGALTKLLLAVDKAQGFIMKNRDASIQIVSKRLNLEKSTVEEIWDSYQFKMFLDQTILTDLEAEARWAIENKFTHATSVPDYLDFIDTSLLESIRPEAVSLIH